MKNIFVIIFFLLSAACFQIFAQDYDILEDYNGDFEAGMTHWRFFEVPNDLGSTAEFVTDDVAQGIQAVKLTFVANDGTLQDHGFDNFDTNCFLNYLETEFNILIPDNDINALDTVGNTLNYLDSRFN